MKNTADLFVIKETIYKYYGKKYDCNYYNRNQEYLEPRQVVMYFCFKHVNRAKLREIGNLFNKTHGTVLNSLKKVNDMIDTNREFRSKMAFINNLITDRINKSELDYLLDEKEKIQIRIDEIINNTNVYFENVENKVAV